MTNTNTASGAAEIATRLRNACASVRNKSYPLADLIPLMQQAADALASAAAPALQPGTAYAALPDDRESFKAYLKECDECAIVPDVAGAFNAAWQRASRGQAPAEQPAPSAAPAGFAIVPVDATDAMMDAFAKAAAAEVDWHGATEVERQEVRDGFGPAYRAMLAAAPQPSPTPQADSQPAPTTTRQIAECYGDCPTGPKTCANPCKFEGRAARAPADSVTAPAGGDSRVPEAWTNLLAYVLQDDLHNRLTPRVIDIAYTAFMQAKRPNDEDGGASDWFNDTRPIVRELIAKLRKDLIEELVTPPAQAADSVPTIEYLRSQITGMSVSVDVSTGDDDAGHRYFGTVTEVMECQGDKHGVTLLVQDAEPNFKADSVLEDAALPQAARDVLAERQRQISAEGWTPEHDDEHVNDEIAAMACYYVMPPGAREWSGPDGYGATLGEAIRPEGWDAKDCDRRRELVKGAALALAELERIDRAAMAAKKGGEA